MKIFGYTGINIFCSILAIACVVAAVFLWAYMENKTLRKTGTVLSSLAGIVFFILACSVTVIPTGYTGVKTTFGQISQTSIPNGINFHIPFAEHIEKVNSKQQDINFEGETWSETKTRTAMYYADVTVTYRINPEKSAWIYANVSDYKKSLVSPELAASALKATSKELSDEDATNRGVVEPRAAEQLQAMMDAKYGKDVVFIHKVTIGNADFEDSYNAAIAEKQKAQLAYEKQQIENKRELEKAENDAKKKRVAAQAAADAAVTKAEGTAKANRALNDSITEQVLMEKCLEKWDGQLPNAMLGDGTKGVFDVSGLAMSEQASE